MIPAYLKKGDCIAIVATARKVTPEEIAPAVSIFEEWGLTVKFGEHLFAAHNQFAGTDAERLQDLQAMLDNPTIKAVFCARGGYGTVKIIDGLSLEIFKKSPKWIVGFSDVTVLHSHIHKHTGIETLHATMPWCFAKEEKDSQSLQTLQQVLLGQGASYTFPTFAKNIKGECEGVLVGGNLSILYSLLASPSDIDTAGKILFIEDLDEYLYHIDRMMMALKRSGKLSRLKGLIVGGMTDMHNNAMPFGKTVEEIILEAVAEYNYPVCFNAPAGHIDNENCTLILGHSIKLEVTEKLSSIKFL